MTAIGPGVCTQDKTYGWADVKANIHPLNFLQKLSVDLWKLSADLQDCVTDNRRLTQADIKFMQNLAQELDDYVSSKERHEQQMEEEQLRHGG